MVRKKTTGSHGEGSEILSSSNAPDTKKNIRDLTGKTINRKTDNTLPNFEMSEKCPLAHQEHKTGEHKLPLRRTFSLQFPVPSIERWRGYEIPLV